MELLNILIPTFNRSKDLQKNLEFLQKEIQVNSLQSQVRIIVSDNCSNDNTVEMLNAFQSAHPELLLEYKSNVKNIGLAPNVVEVLKMAHTQFVLFCGDDDLIASGYLLFCVNSIKERSSTDLGCIIPGIKSVNHAGEEKIGRIHSFDTLNLTAGYDALHNYSHMAHQMSGLVVNKENLLINYLDQDKYRNPYLFIFFVAFNLLHKDSIFAPMYKTAVQIDNEKDWGYNEIGLLDEVFKSYQYFEKELTEKQLATLLIHFVRMHSYRITIKKREPDLVIKQARQLSKLIPENTTFNRSIFILLFKEYLLKLIA